MTLKQAAAEYRGFRTAGIRLNEELVDTLQFHRTDKLFDTIESIHQFDKAHTVMLTEQGLIPREAGAAILRTLRGMEKDHGQARFEAQGGKHSGEQHLIRTLGEDVGGWINTARSSGDLGQIGRYLTTRNHVLKCLPAILEAREAFLKLAERFDDVVIPGQTFLQHGQPTKLGHWCSMWASVLERDFARFVELYSRTNRSPAGAAIMTGSDFDVDRHRVAELLGFDAPIEHTMDAIFSQDTLLETITAVAVLWNDLGRLGEDLELWLSTEYQYLDFPDRFCDTSSIMPQKRNPSVPQQLKTQTAKAIGNVTTAFVAERGSSGQPQNARYEAERILWESFAAIPMLLHDVSLMMAEAQPAERQLKKTIAANWSASTDLAGYIVRESGMPWRTAHQITAIVVRLAEERQLVPAAVTAALVDEAAALYLGKGIGLSDELIQEALDPNKFVERRTLFGGPGADAHRATRDRLAKSIQDDKETLNRLTASVSAAAEELDSAIDAIVGGDDL